MNDDTDKPVTIDLRPGRNVIGLKVSLPAGNGKWAWHDFKYVTLISTACDVKITPARQYCVVGQRCPLLFAVSTELPLDGLAIDWYVDSALRRSDGPREMDYVAPSEEGPHYIKAALRSKETGRILCEAEAMANVQPKPAAAKEPAKAVEPPPPPSRGNVEPPPPPSGLNPEGWAMLHKCSMVWVAVDFADYEAPEGGQIGGRPIELIAGTAPLAWNGTTFVWTYSTDERLVYGSRNAKGEIRGTMSPDGLRILNLTASETLTTGTPDRTDTTTWRIEAKDIGMDTPMGQQWDREIEGPRLYDPRYREEGKKLGALVVKLEYTFLRKNSSDLKEGRSTFVDPHWNDASSITVLFELPHSGGK